MKFTLNPKKLLIIISTLIILFLLLILRTINSPPPSTPFQASRPCNSRIPETLADTIIHYATSNITPQQTLAEISVTAGVLRVRSPACFLVFGLGLDSPLWAALNHAGRTVFLEEDESWIATVGRHFPSLEVYHVRYDTKVGDADELMEIGRRPECRLTNEGLRELACQLMLKGLLNAFYEEEWDLIMVDGPTGWIAEAPGRMGAIYAAGMAARGRKGEGETDVFVHDVNRKVENEFSMEFLCKSYLKKEVGRLRHFSIPSYGRSKSFGMPFCPLPF